MALNQVVYTNVHELNLDWIIGKIKEFQSTLDEWKVIIDGLNDIESRLISLETKVTEIDTLSDEIDTINNLITTVQKNITALETALETESEARINNYTDLVAMIEALETKFDTITGISDSIIEYVDALNATTKAWNKAYTDTKIKDLITIVNTYYVELKAWLKELEKALESVASRVYNWNAYAYADDGLINFDLNNKLIYQHTGNNLTAQEYLSLDMSADEYAKYVLTADEYLMFSKDRLHFDYVLTPITAAKQHVTVAIDELLAYIKGTMTASEFAGLNLTADDYAELDLSAWDYLSLNTSLNISKYLAYIDDNGPGITANQYAHLSLVN